MPKYNNVHEYLQENRIVLFEDEYVEELDTAKLKAAVQKANVAHSSQHLARKIGKKAPSLGQAIRNKQAKTTAKKAGRFMKKMAGVAKRKIFEDGEEEYVEEMDLARAAKMARSKIKHGNFGSKAGIAAKMAVRKNSKSAGHWAKKAAAVAKHKIFEDGEEVFSDTAGGDMPNGDLEVDESSMWGSSKPQKFTKVIDHRRSNRNAGMFR
jgi:hypothetical protein